MVRAGWYGRRAMVSTPVALPARRFAAVLACQHLIGETESRRLAVSEQVGERLPPEALTAETEQSDEARRGRLGIGECVMRASMDHAELLAQTLESNGVVKAPESSRQPCGVDVVGIQRGAHGARNQPGVERVSAVLDEHRALDEAAEPLDDTCHVRSSAKRLCVDAVDAAGVRIDAVTAVHERLEAQQMPLEGEGHRPQLHQLMRGLAGGLAVERHEAQRLDRCVASRPWVRALGRIVNSCERFRPCRAEPLDELIADGGTASPPSVA